MDDSKRTEARSNRTRRVLIIVENLPVPFDRRVWRECMALRDAGYGVSVIAPRDTAQGEPARETLNGVSIYRFRPFHSDGGFLSYLMEYAVAVLKSFWLTGTVLRREGFQIIQICNPPDLLVLAALPYKLLGKQIVFDQHDLCPEIYQSQKGLSEGEPNLVLAFLQLFERLTYRMSNAVLVVNESCRRVACSRGGKAPEDVFVVRNGPTAESIREVAPDPTLKKGQPFLLTYVGMMGPQEGIDVLLRAVRALRESIGRDDFHVHIIGGGTVLDQMKQYAVGLGLDSVVTFAGRQDYEGVLRGIASADVCLCPDPKTPLSDKCSLVKSIEYMSLGKPFVAFDLEEVRLSAGDAALYARAGDEVQYAELIHQLLEDAGLREAMGQRGRRRVLDGLTWDHSTQSLYEAYDSLFAAMGGNPRGLVS